MSANRETKLKIIDALFGREEWTKQVNSVEYRTRCPYCGDSLNENTGHLYIRIDPDDNLPIVFHCFKCEESGVLRAETLAMMDINDVGLKSELATLNKTADKLDGKNISQDKEMLYFDFQLPDIRLGDEKIKYVENRLGVKIPEEDYEKIKIIPSLYDFLRLNDITVSPLRKYQMDRIDDHYVGFLSYGNSHILFRDISNKEDIRWIKYPILPDSQRNRLFYTISGSIDIFTNETITINLSEGVMDILSVYYNLGYDKDNTMNIAVSGKYYEAIMLFLIDSGLVGSNIIVNIFADNDAVFGKKGKTSNSTTIGYYRKTFKYYKCLFKEVNIYYNTIGKDVGVPRDKISLKHYKL